MLKLIGLLLVAVLSGCTGSPAVDESRIPLTEQELAYISSHPSVSWAMEDNRPPYIFVENGNIQGLSIDYLKVIAKKTGLKFLPVRTFDFVQSLAAIKNGKVDLITSLRPTPERAAYIGFTQPVAYNGGVFLFRVNTLPRSPLTTGIMAGGAVKEYLSVRFPDMKIIEVEDNEEAIALLQKGLLDGVVMDEGSADFLTKRSIVELRKANINFDYPYSFGYTKDNHMLGSIMTKAITSISSKDKQTLNKKWIEVKK